MNRVEQWILQNKEKFEHESVTSTGSTYHLSRPQVFVTAGSNPRNFAKQFGASFKVRNGSWDAEFPDFILTLLDATESEQVVL